MTKNNLYAKCREEAIEQLQKELKKDYYDVHSNHILDISQLTAEIYGMKLLEKAKESWFEIWEDKPTGTIQDQHDWFVNEFNNDEGK